NYTAAKKKNAWIKWGAMAACLALVISFAIPLTQLSQDKLPTEDIQRIEYNNAFYEVCEEKSVLKRLGIKAPINETDAGDMITYLTKKNPGGRANTSQLSKRQTSFYIPMQLLLVKLSM